MNRIFKYPLRVEHRQVVFMHASAKPLWVCEQSAQLVLYAEVDWPEPGDPVERMFQVVTTGDEYSADHKRFVGACTLGTWFQAFVFELDVTAAHEPIDRRHADDYVQLRQDQVLA